MSIFTRLPISVPDSSLPTLKYSDVARLKNEFESGAYDHWVFDSGDTAALAGRVNGKMLTALGGPHTYGANQVTINVTQGKALQSDYIETRRQTLVAVVRPNNAASTMVIAGTRGAANGSMLYFGSTLTKLSANQNPASFVTDNVQPLSVGNYYFCALAETDVNGTTDHIVYLSGVPQLHAGGALKALSGMGVALGSLQNATVTGATLSFAEFMVFDESLSVAELDAVYARSKSRMAERGITVI